MPRLRTLVVALAVGVGVGAYLQVWIGFPGFVAVAVGAVMAVVILLIATSLGDDGAAADAAWRAASGDLAARARVADPDEDDDAGRADDRI